MLALSFTLFLYAFGYGGLTSFVALYTDSHGVTPRALYFTVFSITIIVTRPFIGRFADRVGYRRVFLPCVVLVTLGFALLAVGGSRPCLIASAVLFGTGFGSAYPVFLAHVLKFVDDTRRGATFGSIIGAFDTGIGTGSIAMGWIIEHFGFPYRVGHGGGARRLRHSVLRRDGAAVAAPSDRTRMTAVAQRGSRGR